MKKIIAVILILNIFFCLLPAHGIADEKNDIKILCLGSYLEPDVKPFYADSRIMAPVRYIFESIGAEVSWNEEKGQAVGVKDGTEVVFTLGSNIMTVNGNEFIMDTVLLEKESRVFAPIRFVAESFGYKVSFHQQSETAVISRTREYDFYDNVSVPLPLFETVTNAGFLKKVSSENQRDIYYYSYHEDYVTEYFNTLQADFGYVGEYASYNSSAFVYRYVSLDRHIVSVEDYCREDSLVCIKVTPDYTGEFTVYNDTSDDFSPPVVVPDEPAGTPIPENGDFEDTQSGEWPDYAEVTGAKFIGEYESEDGTTMHRYSYNQFAHMNYETILMRLGWQLYDFDFNIDSFTNTSFYTDGERVLSVGVSYVYHEVWIVYPQE